MTINLRQPPAWAQSLLHLLLKQEDQETVSGDLLEEYREEILPSRGQRGADLWYVKQMAGFLWFVTAPFGCLLAAAIVVRFLIDVFVPTTNFVQRSELSTVSGAAIYALAGAYCASRTGHVRSGMLAAVGSSLFAGVVNIVVTMVILAVRHDPRTLDAIRASGGLDEHLTLVLFPLLPGGVLLATIGGFLGKGLSRRAGSAARRS